MPAAEVPAEFRKNAIRPLASSLAATVIILTDVVSANQQPESVGLRSHSVATGKGQAAMLYFKGYALVEKPPSEMSPSLPHRSALPRVRRDAELSREIRRVFDEDVHIDGARKAWRQMLREGFGVARCAIARLMARPNANKRRLLEPIGNIPPIEAEPAYLGRRKVCSARRQTKQPSRKSGRYR